MRFLGCAATVWRYSSAKPDTGISLSSMERVWPLGRITLLEREAGGRYMAEAAAERFQILDHTEIVYEQPIVLVQAVPERAEDEFTRKRAARFIGACTLSHEVEVPRFEAAQVAPIESLHDAIHRAEQGDAEAYKMVETNVKTDVIERTIKTGHIMSVALGFDEAGRIQQHGQTMESVQANSLKYAASSWQMRERTEAETTNSFRIDQLHRQGVLQDYYFIVISLAADNMGEKEMSEAGFFTDTMSCAIQATCAVGDTLTTESAFVAGVKTRGAARHDKVTAVALGERLGVNLRGKSAAGIIATPLLVHKSLMPNGVIDLVKIYDDCAGGTFFGEDKPAQNYAEYREKCRGREAALQPKVESITKELIAEASAIRDPIMAVKRLHKISEARMVEQAAFDDTINPRVFGSIAAEHIIAARNYQENGDWARALHEVNWAKRTAISSSCPTALLGSSQNENTESERDNSRSGEDDNCEYISKECPKCNAKNVKTTVTKHRIKGDCGCSVRKK